MIITSRENEGIKRARAIRDGKQRSLLFIEGARLCEEAASSKLKLKEIFVVEEALKDPRVDALVKNLSEKRIKVRFVDERLMESLSETKSSQGVVLIAEKPNSEKENFVKAIKETPLFVMLHKTNNPANAGAIVRTAEAAGANGIIATKGSTYLFAPKALRGSMGSIFRLPVWLGVSFEEAVVFCKEKKIQVVCADANSQKTFTEHNWKKPSVLIMGEEGEGLSDKEIALADSIVSIPMKPPVESLNVAVSAGIILYEAATQRSK